MFRVNSLIGRYGNRFRRLPYLLLSTVAGVLGGVLALLFAAGQGAAPTVLAGPLLGGVPKLILSTKSVTPAVAPTGGAVLTYTFRLVNTGAWTATSASLTDFLPAATTYISGSLQTPPGSDGDVQNGVLIWNGEIGFDSTALITLSVSVTPTFAGPLTNTAVLSDARIGAPLMLTAVTMVTDAPALTLAKSSAPALPGPGKGLIYTLTVTNEGQAAVNLPITVTDRVPFNTTFDSASPDGDETGGVITWTRSVNLGLGASTQFTFSVHTGGVLSGTKIVNDDYRVTWTKLQTPTVTAGPPYTVTVIDPIFLLSKKTVPDPPGANSDLTYILTLYNRGSLATNLVITDRVPAGALYLGGGEETGGVVAWALPSLDTGATAEFSYTVAITDVAGFALQNTDYAVCSAETCQAGRLLASWVNAPTLQVFAYVDPIAKKPGGGKTGVPVTPTLVVRNLGPGAALDVRAALYFQNISVSNSDVLAVIPPTMPLPTGPTGACGEQCRYDWRGSLAAGQTVTFTTVEGQSTIGGEPGNRYTATVVVSNTLTNFTTAPITATASGLVTHDPNLIPTKSAPAVIGRGQLLTYSIDVQNTGLSTNFTQWLTDVVPLSTTFVSASPGGMPQTMSGTTVVSWTLPALSTGSSLNRWFSVRVDDAVVSGTQILNNNYRVTWLTAVTSTVFNAGPPVTTTVKDVGLIDSFKVVTPAWAVPGAGNLLTYVVNIVNTSALSLTGVQMDDVLPWQVSTYQRDAVASAGAVVSDIVTLHWTGSVAPFSSQRVTFTVRVDPGYEGPVVNTAVISHTSLLAPVEVSTVGYITSKPVLSIFKEASPDPVSGGAPLEYTLHVHNTAQLATGLVITDVIPANTSYVTGTATAGGLLVENVMRWDLSVLRPDETGDLKFRVTVQSGQEVVNDKYGAASAEGATALGLPVITKIKAGTGGGPGTVYLPFIRR